MHDVRTGVALFLLLNVLACLVRVARGPTLADRLLVAQLFGTSGAAVLLLLSAAPGMSAMRDVALTFAVLAPITVVAFVRYAAGRWTGGDP
ncbi:monovalent cation/H+ antiporter complex subunit F [Sorangium sp. So ce1036]|uniref:monovalent cation/H+ antiporter complex subunit F n=1 Tax=Sorangium sp. So ce1036 TaxID=3133328 RepID=UPI003F07DECE